MKKKENIYEITYYYLSDINLNIYTDNPTNDMIKRIHTAKYTYDKSCNMYTCYSTSNGITSNGGTVISGTTLKDTKKKYKEAFITYILVQSLVDIINIKGLDK